jgi:hypothetical protein
MRRKWDRKRNKEAGNRGPTPTPTTVSSGDNGDKSRLPVALILREFHKKMFFSADKI